MTHQCPICGKALREMLRYPHYVCGECASRATSADGRRLNFYNIGVSGGYAAKYADDLTDYDSHYCYIDGHPCIANEARFGGIVVQILPNQSQ